MRIPKELTSKVDVYNLPNFYLIGDFAILPKVYWEAEDVPDNFMGSEELDERCIAIYKHKPIRSLTISTDYLKELNGRYVMFSFKPDKPTKCAVIVDRAIVDILHCQPQRVPFPICVGIDKKFILELYTNYRELRLRLIDQGQDMPRQMRFAWLIDPGAMLLAAMLAREPEEIGGWPYGFGE